MLKFQVYKNSMGFSKNWKQRRKTANTLTSEPKLPAGNIQNDIEKLQVKPRS
jgi:hypothetical protein